MKKITKSNNNIFFKRILPLLLLLSFVFNPLKVNAEIAETEINGELINASSEFLRDLDFETASFMTSYMANAGSSRSSQYLSVSMTISISLIMVFSLGVVLYLVVIKRNSFVCIKYSGI